MIDFVCVLSIILELILTYILIVKIIELEKHVNGLNQKLFEIYELILLVNKKIKNTISKINKVVSILTNRKFITARRIIALTVDIIQVIIFVRSLNLSKGFNFKKINYKTLKKLFIANTLRGIVRKILLNVSKLASV